MSNSILVPVGSALTLPTGRHMEEGVMITYDEMLGTLGLRDEDITVIHDLLKDTVLGETRFEYGPPRHARIVLQPRLMSYPAMEKAVLWHELCHTEPWVHRGVTEGHEWSWFLRLWKLPSLAVYDMFVGVLWLFVK